MGFRDLRELAALSQAELALKAGVSRATIVGIEGGRLRPQAATIRKLAAALDVQPAQVVQAIREDQQRLEGELAA